jgi:drug/metabolite transporter (DMT)-like permease
VGLIISGTANAVLNKLQAVPMYNYPNFTNIFGNFLFIPITFAYILPAYRYGWFQQSISQTQWTMSLRPFAIMGALDCVTGMMQVFSAVYLPGPLIVLLPQAAIPISMIFSETHPGARYRTLQYLGALVVLVGIVVVLEPEFSHRNSPDYICEAIHLKDDCTICQVEISEEGCLSHRLDGKPVVDFEQYVLRQSVTDDGEEGTPICEWIAAADSSNGEKWLVLLWSGILIFSCFPMTLSTIYKEIVLDNDMDPIFLNGWIVIFQTVYSMLLAVPAGMASTPPVLPKDMPNNILDGFKCYMGINSIDDGCHPDDCSTAALYFNWGICASLLYMLTSMFVVKLGSTSLLFLGLTIMVPLGNLAFAILPSEARTTFHASDIVGLAVILLGLLLYRFSGPSKTPLHITTNGHPPDDTAAIGATTTMSLTEDTCVNSLTEPLLPADHCNDSLEPILPTPAEFFAPEPLLSSPTTTIRTADL